MLKSIESYQKTSSYERLLSQYSLEEYGVWEVLGEDPNCDWGGYHHMPSLKFLEGKLCDVIRVGVNLPRFWGWGSGGDFRKISVEKV